MQPSGIAAVDPAGNPASDPAAASGPLVVTLELERGSVLFEWPHPGSSELARVGRLRPMVSLFAKGSLLFDFQFEPAGIEPADSCWGHSASIRAMLRRIRLATPPVAEVQIGILADLPLGPATVGSWHRLAVLPGDAGWKWLGGLLAEVGKAMPPLGTRPESALVNDPGPRLALHVVAAAQLGVPPHPAIVDQLRLGRKQSDLRITLDRVEGSIEAIWADPDSHRIAAVGRIVPTGFRRLEWSLVVDEQPLPLERCALDVLEIRAQLDQWLERCPVVDPTRLTVVWRYRRQESDEPVFEQEPPFAYAEDAVGTVARFIGEVAEEYFFRRSPLGRVTVKLEADRARQAEAYADRMARREQKKADEAARRKAKLAEVAEQKRRRDEARDRERAAAEARKAAEAKPAHAAPPRPALAIPPVPVSVRVSPVTFQETTLPVADLRGFARREMAALWWVSNQSDDLLSLPQCRIQRLEYQLRTALRVLGPLRGRALLSDEVGLGKTIEAGLIAKELFTRGMVGRLLVLTLPSLVDQWAAELDEKFGLVAATTNQPAARDPENFWRENRLIVASLHTLKQPAQLELARRVHWDLLIVDEAHHLRNRTSQAWQAVNALPRQFLLLLTATPVQNSLEELYNLVTLLQPGQLPSPKEFRARFLDPERPRQPREPEELRRLLGQVMIRNTRASAGIQLPPRRAETVMLARAPAAAEFWRAWEPAFRARLAELPANQSSLWGRLLLQALGSSPAAWRGVLEKFPAAEAARQWREEPALEAGWQRKCELLVPLAREPGGAVIFTQFLETQSAIATFLRAAGMPVFVINGATPASERQPITEEFQRQGGALLLTQSGTEGRNLQFCHTLVNFDLPWNPLEIEQRIGRLHRLGQRHPVRICNFVEEGTLQEHLLLVLQEKLNLFELVVGETGLVLGERYSGDEFETEVFQRWRDSEGNVAQAIAALGDELVQARDRYREVKELDETLFADDFESR